MHLTPEEREIGKDNYHEVIGSLDSRRDFLKKTVAAAAVPSVGMGAMYFGYDSAPMGDRVRVGVIGTGDEGNVLIGALNPEYVDVVAIADIRPYNIYRAINGDHSSDNALKARPGLLAKYGKVNDWKTEGDLRKDVEIYENGYEDLLDDTNVEAVIIALPLHLHDQAAIKAMRKRKHVLTEKLMAHSVHQCKEMGRVAAQENLLLATGHQRHYSVLYDNAVDMIRQGLLGDIHHIRAQWHRGNMPGKDSWSQPLPLSPDENVKAFQEILTDVVKFDGTGDRKKLEQRVLKAYKDGLSRAVKAGQASGGAQGRKDADREYKQLHKILASINSWTNRRDSARKDDERKKWSNLVTQGYHRMADMFVQAEDFGYGDRVLEGEGTKITALEELIRWRLWDRTGGGLMAELGSHQLDAASIFIKAGRKDGKKVQPLSVLAVGGRHIFPHDRDVDDHVYCMFEFPAEGYESDPNKKIVVTYSSINGNGLGGHGEMVFGTKGTLILEREAEALFIPGSKATRIEVNKKDDVVTLDTTDSGPTEAAALSKAAGPISRGYTEEIEHWAWCIRNPSSDPKNQPKCGPAVALADATIALTANIAMKKNERIEFDSKWFDIESDETPEGIKPKKADDLG